MCGKDTGSRERLLGQEVVQAAATAPAAPQPLPHPQVGCRATASMPHLSRYSACTHAEVCSTLGVAFGMRDSDGFSDVPGLRIVTCQLILYSSSGQ